MKIYTKSKIREIIKEALYKDDGYFGRQVHANGYVTSVDARSLDNFVDHVMNK